MGNDLDIIIQLENDLGINLKQVKKNDIIKNIFLIVISPSGKKEGAYVVDEAGRIICLGLVNVRLHSKHLQVISQLKSLQQFSLVSTACSDYTFLQMLSNLKALCLNDNHLNDASFLSGLSNLTTLNLCNNNLSDGSFLNNLSNLTTLNLRGNSLNDIYFIKNLVNLKKFDLGDNPIKNPPPEIVEEGIDAIRNYIKQMEEQGRDKLYEAKLLFVGEPGAGKTSLMKKILNPDYKIPNREEEPTLGINIEPSWVFSYHRDKNITFKTNMWDFGGQPIQYMLHQYFLTSRSLYVLLSDDREQRTRFDYWFDIIKILGEDSPVLVVLNEKKHRSISDFDYDRYKKRYAAAFSIEKRDVDLSKQDGRISALVTKIEEMLCSLEHIGDELPAQWIPIRKELEKIKSQNQIGISCYFEICKAHGLKEEQDMLTLCGYLCSLGVILHYKDDPALEDTLFVNPHWIVDALYTALSDKTLADNRGTFKKKWLFNLWGKKGYSYDERCKLLNLMLKHNFEICYPIVDKKDEYMAPMLLPDVEPEYKPLPETGALKFRYQYPFLPEGIVSRLIVRLHEDIEKEEGKDVIWKRGVVFRRAGTRARVVEDRSEKGLEIIDIIVAGEINEKLTFLTIIREEINKIHKKSFQDIAMEEMVPCCCPRCINTTLPHYFEYSELQRYLRAGQSEITCSLSIKSVNISNLIEAVIPGREFSEYLKYHSKEIKALLAQEGEYTAPAFLGSGGRKSAGPVVQKVDKEELKALEKKIAELEEELEPEMKHKELYDKLAEDKINRFNWWLFGFNALLSAGWAVLIFVNGWESMEKWTYIAGLFVLVINSLYFALYRKKFNSEEVRTKRLEEEKKKLYELHKVKTSKIERLQKELAEAKARRTELLK